MMGDKPQKKDSTKSDASKEKSDTPKKQNDFLVVPSNPISGGDAVPVGIKITAAALASLAKGLAAKNLTVTQSTIELFWKDKAIATFDLTESICSLVNRDQELHLSTRIKVPKDVASGDLKAVVSATVKGQPKPLTKSEVAPLAIEKSDNSAVSMGQLVLSLQPTQSALKDVTMVAVKAIVPKPPLETRELLAIDGAVRDLTNPPAGDPPKLITMTIKAHDLLSDEVFLGFNFIPSTPTMLEMSWTYNKDDVSQNLIATACLSG
jgi:hypothetical protein